MELEKTTRSKEKVQDSGDAAGKKDLCRKPQLSPSDPKKVCVGFRGPKPRGAGDVPLTWSHPGRGGTAQLGASSPREAATCGG